MLARLILALTALVLAGPAAAHPGHGEPGQGQTLLHYLTEPIHVVSALAIAFVIVSGVGLVRRRRQAASQRRESVRR